MIRTTILLLFVFSVHSSVVFAQQTPDGPVITPTDCTVDSLNYEMFFSQLDSFGMAKAVGADQNRPMKTLSLAVHGFSDPISGRLEQDSYCSLLLYVAGFNYLLESGLDLSFNYAESKPEHSYVVLGVDDAKLDSFAGRDDTFRDSYRLFSTFLILKGKYEENMLPSHWTDEKSKGSYLDLIDDIIVYGTYSQPESLRKILRSEFSHLTTEKLNQDIRATLNKKVQRQ